LSCLLEDKGGNRDFENTLVNPKSRMQLVHSKAAEIETNVDDKFVNQVENESDPEVI